ncbi:hypothetical protein [Sediminibacterium sp.]|uniref:DinB/UmuC family translesion DNA polymerase n=1 Tax=Sediminibacterium sp. TaxID=1917865 RepID=UPI0025F8D0D5|nr:hypothetical protein [Sediminibacterium sp.]
MSTEHTSQQDTIDLNFLNAELARMTEKLAFQLRCDNRLTGCISVKIRYTDFETHNNEKSIPATKQDHIILKVVRELFTKLFTRRVLVRLIGIRFTNLLPGNYQISLRGFTRKNQPLPTNRLNQTPIRRKICPKSSRFQFH